MVSWDTSFLNGVDEQFEGETNNWANPRKVRQLKNFEQLVASWDTFVFDFWSSKTKQATKISKRKCLLVRNRNNFICGAEIIKKSLTLRHFHAKIWKNRQEKVARSANKFGFLCYKWSRKIFRTNHRVKVYKALENIDGNFVSVNRNVLSALFETKSAWFGNGIILKNSFIRIWTWRWNKQRKLSAENLYLYRYAIKTISFVALK